ncbi:BadF/BadG/BcrA/BcrD ATPase family protein [Amycolatopsis sp. NPDC004169]|uniref:N-acetylglucosamine kinase n=1 Tax=Amycolatopsis sp. NPDC004169 TaxID=3154453 RepID=UPI0033B9241E
MTSRLVLGMDIGGTSSRALVADVDGTVLGTGVAGGGNPVAHGARALAAIRDALRAALAGVDPADVEAAVFGWAGGDVAMRDPEIGPAVRAGWQQAGLRCVPAMVSDVTLAYVSGTDATDGTVLVAGTGAVAAAMGDRVIARCTDGHGWLLGDRGSGFWLGRKAVQATLAALDRGGPLSGLDLEVLRALGVPRGRGRLRVDATIEAVHRRPPVALAELAPIVLAAADAGHQDAVLLTTRAARHLTASVRRVRDLGATTPVVLGGGLLATPSPLSRTVRAAVARQWPDAEITTAGNGAAAAAWLASAALPGARPARHEKLVRGLR